MALADVTVLANVMVLAIANTRGVDQISQFQPNFTILEYLKYLEYLDLGQFRNFCDVFNS